MPVMAQLRFSNILCLLTIIHGMGDGEWWEGRFQVYRGTLLHSKQMSLPVLMTVRELHSVILHSSTEHMHMQSLSLSAFLRAWNHARMCMQVCVCHGLFVWWLELTYNCLWFDSGLCFARVLFFHSAFLCILCVCIIAFDMVVLCEAMLICPPPFFLKSVYRVYIIAVARWIFQTRPRFYFYLLPFGDTTILCIDVCVVILARTDCKTRLLPKIFILEY